MDIATNLFLLASPLGIESYLSHHLAEKGQIDREQGQSIEQLKKENHELKLYLATVIRLLVSKGVLKQEEVETIVRAIELGWLPSQGMKTVGADLEGASLIVDRAAHLVLPFAALAIRHLAVNARMMRSSMLEVAYEDFVTVARAKGLNEKAVIARHMVPNALMPVVTIIGVDVGFLFTGSVLVETVFGWPGIGRLMYESIVKRDYPVLMGNFLISTALVVVVNLIVDLIYVWLDPRVKYTK